MMVIKKHWLHGNIKFNVDVQKEDECGRCVHWRVCRHNMDDFCLNYILGTSEKTACSGCLHRHTRKIWHEKDGFPCFKCKHFKEVLE